MKENKVELRTPFVEFLEKVSRPVYFSKGDYKGMEYVTVTQQYNEHGIKIRKQCSSCQHYKHPKSTGSMTYTYCDKTLRPSSPSKVDIPDGRYCCKAYEMADWCKEAGTKTSRRQGKVLSGRFVKWFSGNYLRLLKEFCDVALGSSWDEWHIYKYKAETGEDIYGNSINND